MQAVGKIRKGFSKKARARQSGRSDHPYSLFLSTRLSFIVAVILLLALINFLSANTLGQQRKYQELNYPNALPLSTVITPSPTATPSLMPYAENAKPQIVEKDPVITCNISPECGGGSRRMKRSNCNSMTCCLTDSKCGGPKFITKTECNNSYCCLLNDGAGKLLSSKSACDNYYSYSKNNSYLGNTASKYPPCVVYYPALRYSQTYNNISSEECLKWQNEADGRSSLISCVVNYPCTGATYTYQVDQATCNFMQSGAIGTCSLEKSIQKMQEITNKNYSYPQAEPLNGTIHMESTPTCRMTPYGCH